RLRADRRRHPRRLRRGPLIFHTVEALAKLQAELLQESIQESGFSSQNVAMRRQREGSEAVHSEFWILNTARAKRSFA
ncbi:MAG TPA: hypothetical protein PLK81_06110, partial [Kiritimatiellia bacterium]|nr:hypothetical protein [Kiritimatiellia bacterium]